MYKIIIDFEKCNSCGDCVGVCTEEILILDEELVVVVNEENCVNCEACTEICEIEAIIIDTE